MPCRSFGFVMDYRPIDRFSDTRMCKLIGAIFEFQFDMGDVGREVNL